MPLTVDGRTYGYPVAVEAVSLIYNRDLLPNRRNLRRILKIDEDLKKNGKRAIAGPMAPTSATPGMPAIVTPFKETSPAMTSKTPA